MRPTHCQFDKLNCQVFITVKKIKLSKIRKDHLRIIFFLTAILDLCFQQFISMQDLKNNNWTILDPPGSNYEIYVLI